ncbi:hypothetical protein BOW53_02925 [Solemya pervernicosa gill symbiont]|uniref:Uncharacterized protein n=1 Tax=Solemya pervernicosa gill symbiont TaxID=642797 RepID=A0A1T2L978_9GAMM|nr:hypothetical protein [Solemya pervernicosa gill symbiont]OOZ41647.1 hypothetical protein BOW53_02925 [Solemya pervernicosa gill symbiont]
MGDVSWPTIGALLTIMAVLIGYVRYTINDHKSHVKEKFEDLADKIKGNKDATTDLSKQQHTENQTLHKRITETRETMNSEFVKHDHLDRKLDDQGRTLSAVLDRLSKIASSVNQLIGAHNGKVESNDD